MADGQSNEVGIEYMLNGSTFNRDSKKSQYAPSFRLFYELVSALLRLHPNWPPLLYHEYLIKNFFYVNYLKLVYPDYPVGLHD